jgi:hypothetical protein
VGMRQQGDDPVVCKLRAVPAVQVPRRDMESLIPDDLVPPALGG